MRQALLVLLLTLALAGAGCTGDGAVTTAAPGATASTAGPAETTTQAWNQVTLPMAEDQERVGSPEQAASLGFLPDDPPGDLVTFWRVTRPDEFVRACRIAYELG